MEKMNWATLINDKRFGLEDYHDPKKTVHAPIFAATTTALYSHRLSEGCRIKHRYSLCRAVFSCTIDLHTPWRLHV